MVGPRGEHFGILHARRRVGAGRGRGHTPRSPPGAQEGALSRRPTPRCAPGRPPRAGALRRAEDPGRASSRQACELPPSGARASRGWPPPLPSPPPPSCSSATLHTAPGVPPGRGPNGATTRSRSRRGRPPASRPSRPGQSSAARTPGLGARGARRPPTERPGWPRAAGETFQNRTLVAAFGSGTLPGPRRLHCFLPLTPSRPLPPPFFPLGPGPCGCPPASVRPSFLPLF